MGCCGLTLYATTVLAGVFTLLDCLLILPFDVLLIVFITVKNGTDISGSHNDLATFIDGFTVLEQSHIEVIILLGIKVGIRVVWFISAICLFFGNQREFRKFLNVWKYLTIIRIIFAIAITVYAIVAFMPELKVLFDGKHGRWHITRDSHVHIAEFTVLIDFLELGPIWLILFIAFALFVHQRTAEIVANKRRRPVNNLWGTPQTNGSLRENFSSIAHPVSLTQEPNPFIIANDNNNVNPNPVPKPKTIPNPLTNDPLKPVLEINDVICIPRATLKPNQAVAPANGTPSAPLQSNVQRFENKSFGQKPHLSALAQRTSYLEYERERDPNKVPKRNNSYNLARDSGQRPHQYNSYDNKAFDYRSENQIYRPVLIKRASVKKNQNQ